jgi:carboxymethylenebutenolidase
VEQVEAGDGGTFTAHVALPEGGSGPGVLVLQEIFGVGEFVKGKCEALAAAGYVALAPDVFWRVEPGFVADGAEDLERAMGLGGRFFTEVSDEQRAGDLAAALAHLRALPEVAGQKAGVLGYCLGGTLAYLLAVTGDPDACVSYYGSGVPGMLELGDRLTCPTLFHFGDSDPYLPFEQVQQVQQRFADRPHVETVVHPGAGHAFENLTNPMFADPEAAAKSWPRTLGFLGRTLR